MAMKPAVKIFLGVLTVGVTITTLTYIAIKIREKFGKGVGQKEATKEDKDSLRITFIR